MHAVHETYSKPSLTVAQGTAYVLLARRTRHHDHDTHVFPPLQRRKLFCRNALHSFRRVGAIGVDLRRLNPSPADVSSRSSASAEICALHGLPLRAGRSFLQALW